MATVGIKGWILLNSILNTSHVNNPINDDDDDEGECIESGAELVTGEEEEICRLDQVTHQFHRCRIQTRLAGSQTITQSPTVHTPQCTNSVHTQCTVYTQ